MGFVHISKPVFLFFMTQSNFDADLEFFVKVLGDRTFSTFTYLFQVGARTQTLE